MSIAQGTAVVVNKSGGPEVLTPTERDFRPPAPGGVRIAAEAVGVAYGDLLLREGLVPGSRRPVVPGYDAVGVVDAIGDGVTAFAVGDRVAVRTDGTGGYASFVEAPTEFVVAVPAAIDVAPAVALVLNYVTAWQMLTRTTALGEGATVVVHAAAGGVGSALAELAAHKGLTVIGTASAARLGALEERGIHAVDRAAGWEGAVREVAPDGVDAVFDGVGGRTARRSFRLLGAGGQLVTYGASGALKNGRRSLDGMASSVLLSPRATALGLFRRGVGMSGYLSSTFVPAHPRWFRDDLANLFAMLANGIIDPVIAAQLPLTSAAEAHAMLAKSVSGKIVLLPAGA